MNEWIEQNPCPVACVRVYNTFDRNRLYGSMHTHTYFTQDIICLVIYTRTCIDLMICRPFDIRFILFVCLWVVVIFVLRDWLIHVYSISPYPLSLCHILYSCARLTFTLLRTRDTPTYIRHDRSYRSVLSYSTSITIVVFFRFEISYRYFVCVLFSDTRLALDFY